MSRHRVFLQFLLHPRFAPFRDSAYSSAHAMASAKQHFALQFRTRKRHIVPGGFRPLRRDAYWP